MTFFLFTNEFSRLISTLSLTKIWHLLTLVVKILKFLKSIVQLHCKKMIWNYWIFLNFQPFSSNFRNNDVCCSSNKKWCVNCYHNMSHYSNYMFTYKHESTDLLLTLPLRRSKVFYLRWNRITTLILNQKLRNDYPKS